ncbi:MAG TPA: AAA family ATPase [Streptosporangiaceae bacterium]|nr:AAA family ATPase [Streptosporangiaceae bacterium]
MLADSAGRHVVLVSGPPAAGKSAIAGPLAAELGFALIAKDRIKETLHDALGHPAEADIEWSGRLGAAAMELLWALAADAPAVVLDANFWPDDPRPPARLRALSAEPVEVHCQCPVSDCMRRYADRAPSRHPVHADVVRTVAEEAFARSARPMALGPVIAVDTTRPVNIQAVAADVRRVLRVGQPLASRGGESVSA